MGAKITQVCREVAGEKGEGVAWRWTLSLVTDGQRHLVARVIYRLHPGLATPVRAATDPQSAFAIQVTAWGGFEVVARVVWRDGTEERVQAVLCLPDGTPAPSIERPGVENADEYYALGKRFQDQNAFKQAREAFEKAGELLKNGVRAAPPSARLDAALIDEKRAVCTYKDPSLPEDGRLDQALALLGGQERLRTIDLPNRLGIAGAIFKRKWELDAQRPHLETALHYYRRGHEIATSLTPAIRATIAVTPASTRPSSSICWHTRRRRRQHRPGWPAAATLAAPLRRYYGIRSSNAWSRIPRAAPGGRVRRLRRPTSASGSWTRYANTSRLP